jgi:hypothetical protein
MPVVTALCHTAMRHARCCNSTTGPGQDRREAAGPATAVMSVAIRYATSRLRYSAMAAFALCATAWPAFSVAHCRPGSSATALHYAANGNFDRDGRYLPSKLGFNLADVSSVSQLDSLGPDVKALVWVGQCKGADDTFLTTVQPYIGNTKVFGFYLMDDPDPRGIRKSGRLSAPCTPENLKAESDWIHRHMPGARTFIVLMNLSSSKTPSFRNSYNPANSHIDLFGLTAYPCRTERHGCDYGMIDRYIAAAASSGIPRSRMVPIYQSFGGGDWIDDYGGSYRLPTPEQTRQILGRWQRYVDHPVFDVVYSWASQHADIALESAAALQGVFLAHNRATPLPTSAFARDHACEPP